ncbi:MAG TPA: DUF177 domain-containing protein [Dehalococcoidia bacterium]|jgi:uncharacterized protein|nr:DUF177 domain-containing protein [Dehalococcoidia bacterium]
MLQYNISGLLKEATGSRREFALDGTVPVDSERVHIVGSVVVVRTKAGALVRVTARGEARLACSRCLEPVTVPITLSIEEEYLQTVDVNTGQPIPIPPSAENFRIDARHTLDLTEALRQYWETAQPMQPLCSPSCPGLCPECGERLTSAPHACERARLDERWAKLLDLRPNV